MPHSKQQQIAARIALAAKKDKSKVKNLKGASLQMYKSMSIRQLEDFAKRPIESKLKHRMKS